MNNPNEQKSSKEIIGNENEMINKHEEINKIKSPEEDNKKRKVSILKNNNNTNNKNANIDIQHNEERRVIFKESPQVIPVPSYKKYNQVYDINPSEYKNNKCLRCCIIF
jgi:hypothetical protein